MVPCTRLLFMDTWIKRRSGSTAFRFGVYTHGFVRKPQLQALNRFGVTSPTDPDSEPHIPIVIPRYPEDPEGVTILARTPCPAQCRDPNICYTCSVCLRLLSYWLCCRHLGQSCSIYSGLPFSWRRRKIYPPPPPRPLEQGAST